MTGRRRDRLATCALVLAVLLPACAGATGQGAAPVEPVVRVAGDPSATTSATTSTTAAPDTTTTAAPAPSTVAAAPPATTAAPDTVPSTVPRPRVVHEQAWTPFAVAGQVVLRHPVARVERVGFHESNHDGAREMEPLPTAADPVTLESRERGTAGRTAADVVVDPEIEVRAPVTGRVKRAGTYVLYCDYSDDFVVIEPDERPGWEVKVLHIDGVLVRAGDRVVAGETVLAQRATQLPFESQVDETTARPTWPHVHIEVVDPSIPDRPSGRGCS